ncbi:MAG: FHA domain-containing protein [Deltaproteobacteria bacterium]|nr:FHA domain-containing protein [Deltaproteobacteria bacterium]
MQRTKTDIEASEWAVNDAVVRLRIWGTTRSFLLLPDAIIGSSSECAIQLHDPTEHISRKHAVIVQEGDTYVLRDLDSKNGIYVDGARRELTTLTPGLEVRIGGVTVIVESKRLIALRSFLARLLGWHRDRCEAVDLALRAVRIAATRHAPLIVSGEEDLIPIAYGIHQRALGPRKPFVVCDPRRRRYAATARSPMNVEIGMEALQAAEGGSLCVRSRRLPRDFGEVMEALRDPGRRVQLIVCTVDGTESHRLVATMAATVNIPRLSSRPTEIDHVINEYGADAVAALDAQLSFTRLDRDWVRSRAVGTGDEIERATYIEIEKATLRRVALRMRGNIAQAAEILEMSHVALGEWVRRRRPQERDDDD